MCTTETGSTTWFCGQMWDTRPHLWHISVTALWSSADKEQRGKPSNTIMKHFEQLCLSSNMALFVHSLHAVLFLFRLFWTVNSHYSCQCKVSFCSFLWFQVFGIWNGFLTIYFQIIWVFKVSNFPFKLFEVVFKTYLEFDFKFEFIETNSKKKKVVKFWNLAFKIYICI